MSMPEIIALVGLSGGGKSTVARHLAARLGWRVCDTDGLVEQMAGRTIPAIFADEGEGAFRERETVALMAALTEPNTIVATGGGIVLRDRNRALLREKAFVVWLDAPTDVLIARLRAHDEERPLLAGDDPAARLETLRAQRAALYRDVAHVTIDTSEAAPEDVAERIVGALFGN
ncbi:Shikimate kinase [Roseiflexus castenholzii DSM 13941]|uniref:Shikimate kinase n=2 Tax=Roseiflexus castenholzii TaxID=120962 RepID=A7NF34_ROSCS|nr:Shikimate kinase [Roseiflexus castenholzii DSM 13941]